MNEDHGTPCQKCGCLGNVECGKPMQDCGLNEFLVCPCCAAKETRRTLAPTEPHPSAQFAMSYIKGLFYDNKLNNYQEAFSSCAIENNRLGEICAETLRRIMAGEPVSDRYVLGLAWAIRDMEDKK